MRRSAMVAGGTALGAVAVMALPHPSAPQQVAIAANAGGARHANATAKTPAASTPTSSAAHTVVGSLATTQYGQLQVKLTVANGRIRNVGFTTLVANDGHSASIDQYAAPILIRETLAAQSAGIQGVSGATYTTGAYEQSLQSAIDRAGLKA
jgi:uncharacterized protein with FMN-binding domain